ncbi:hypothetical protein TRFO_38265 [Tritrichomonas foetus]|uniref:Transmembrane protein n=1 Tax=Tritrichomonas foetus TaxID=1144522 RepID=A0A1J4JED3_9EUKA|nr:hypothetical protein TRFO_38265 [Tritrichomonas foetus]|eukprot:OHS95620.1 hypothetical protein TRFO_38265 [Tritrichomonas foetus]
MAPTLSPLTCTIVSPAIGCDLWEMLGLGILFYISALFSFYYLILYWRKSKSRCCLFDQTILFWISLLIFQLFRGTISIAKIEYDHRLIKIIFLGVHHILLFIPMCLVILILFDLLFTYQNPGTNAIKFFRSLFIIFLLTFTALVVVLIVVEDDSFTKSDESNILYQKLRKYSEKSTQIIKNDKPRHRSIINNRKITFNSKYKISMNNYHENNYDMNHNNNNGNNNDININNESNNDMNHNNESNNDLQLLESNQKHEGKDNKNNHQTHFFDNSKMNILEQLNDLDLESNNEEPERSLSLWVGCTDFILMIFFVCPAISLMRAVSYPIIQPEDASCISFCWFGIVVNTLLFFIRMVFNITNYIGVNPIQNWTNSQNRGVAIPTASVRVWNFFAYFLFDLVPSVLAMIAVRLFKEHDMLFNENPYYTRPSDF